TLLCSHEAFATCCTAEDSSMLLLLLSQYKLDRQRIELMPQRPLNKADAPHRLLLKVRKNCFLHCQWLKAVGAFALFCCYA
ncbi:hypothetical protein, partial [Cesiribacter sp. SM1]|uniref:hypothetical protein n=1 Tax=Cesiribacter sp. SM1 TaxID=2861196 RepID=UPI001CD26058